MASDDDFTFCSVVPSTEAEKVSDDINIIRTDDSLGTTTDKNSNIIRIDDSLGTTNGKNSGSIWNISGSMEKQEKVGSLSFCVIDATTRKEVNQVPKVAAQENGGISLEQKKPPARKSAARGKVPFEKGYSPMDWLKLTRTHPDLAGLKGQSNRRLITLNEVKQHQSGESMWTVLKGRVYNIAPYLKFHPGGVDILMKAVGKDCTSLFNKYHAWVNEDFLLEKCLVGILDSSQ